MQPCLPKELRPCPKHHHKVLGRAKHHGCVTPRPKDCVTTPLGPGGTLPAGPLATASGSAIPKGIALPLVLSIGGGLAFGAALAEGGFFGSGYGGPILSGGFTGVGKPILHSCPKGEVGTYPHCTKPIPIPEPATSLLLFLGMVLLLTMSSLRRKVK